MSRARWSFCSRSGVAAQVQLRQYITTNLTDLMPGKVTHVCVFRGETPDTPAIATYYPQQQTPMLQSIPSFWQPGLQYEPMDRRAAPGFFPNLDPQGGLFVSAWGVQCVGSANIYILCQDILTKAWWDEVHTPLEMPQVRGCGTMSQGFVCMYCRGQKPEDAMKPRNRTPQYLARLAILSWPWAALWQHCRHPQGIATQQALALRGPKHTSSMCSKCSCRSDCRSLTRCLLRHQVKLDPPQKVVQQ